LARDSPDGRLTIPGPVEPPSHRRDLFPVDDVGRARTRRLGTGRDKETLALPETAERSATDDDVDAQVHWRCVRALILARRGSFDQAEALVRKALDLAIQTEATGAARVDAGRPGDGPAARAAARRGSTGARRRDRRLFGQGQPGLPRSRGARPAHDSV